MSHLHSALLLALCLLVAACADREAVDDAVEFEKPETFLEYEVELSGVSDPKVAELMTRALSLYRLQKKGAQSLAFLRRRAEGDTATALKIMRSFGWYGATADANVALVETNETSVDAPRTAIARFTVVEGERYTLQDHQITLVETGAGPAPALPDAAALGSPVGEPAVASDILAAEKEAVEALKRDGRPYAARLGRDAVADPEAAEIEVETTIATGGRYIFGDAIYVGRETVERDYLETYRTWSAGEVTDPERLKAFQRELTATGLFETVSAEFPEDPPSGDEAPVTVTLEEAAPRTISGGLRYDTDAGPAARAGFQHRNLFGANETLTLEALVGLEEQSVNGDYRIPQWRRPGQDLIFGAELRRIDDEAFEELGATLAIGVEREISDEVTIGLGALTELSRTKTITETETAKLFGVPAFVAFDSSDDRLDPTKGVRARLAATPFFGFQAEDPVSFGIIDATISAYFDLTGEKKYVLATRGRLATALASDINVISPGRRLYSGGGGSVRGYAERFIGPLDADGDPSGGRSAVETGVELRARVTDVIGVAAFAEAGAVTEDIAPTLDEGVRVAVGGGVRYFSPVGPIRLDVGVPVNPRSVDDAFQVYISIGQAF